MIISMYAEKTFDDIKNVFIIKVLETVELEETYFNTLKAIYDKYIANTIFNREKFEAVLVKSVASVGCLLS